MHGYSHTTDTHTHTHTHTDRQTPSLSPTWPTSQIRAPFILKYIELLCDSPRQRAAIPLKAALNHLWQRETAKRQGFTHPYIPGLDSGKGGVPLSNMAVMDQHFPSLPALPLVSLTHKHFFFFFSWKYMFCHCFCFLPQSLSFFPPYFCLTGTHNISQRYGTSCCCRKNLFHLISSNRQTWAPQAGDWTDSKWKNIWY